MNIVVTWPKSRSLDSYLNHLARADAAGEIAYFRVSSRPKVRRGDRCYHVHDGHVRGYLSVLEVVDWTDTVPPIDNVTGEQFRPGIYIARHPHFFVLDRPFPMRGFQGFRYCEEG